MSDSEHSIPTPGPWEVHETDDGFEIWMGSKIKDPSAWESQHVLEMRCGLDPEDNAEQYAEAWDTIHVAAAAPLLVDALEAVAFRMLADHSHCWCPTSREAFPDVPHISWCQQARAALSAARPPAPTPAETGDAS